MEEESRSVSGFLHFGTVSKGKRKCGYIAVCSDPLERNEPSDFEYNYLIIHCSFSTQEAAERFGCHRLQSGGPGASTAGLL